MGSLPVAKPLALACLAGQNGFDCLDQGFGQKGFAEETVRFGGIILRDLWADIATDENGSKAWLDLPASLDQFHAVDGAHAKVGQEQIRFKISLAQCLIGLFGVQEEFRLITRRFQNELHHFPDHGFIIHHVNDRSSLWRRLAGRNGLLALHSFLPMGYSPLLLDNQTAVTDRRHRPL